MFSLDKAFLLILIPEKVIKKVIHYVCYLADIFNFPAVVYVNFPVKKNIYWEFGNWESCLKMSGYYNAGSREIIFIMCFNFFCVFLLPPKSLHRFCACVCVIYVIVLSIFILKWTQIKTFFLYTEWKILSFPLIYFWHQRKCFMKANRIVLWFSIWRLIWQPKLPTDRKFNRGLLSFPVFSLC